MDATSAMQRVALVADPGSFEPFDQVEGPVVDPLDFHDRVPYRKRLREARRATGAGEAVLTGSCRLDSHRVVVIASEFGFLGGSIGVAAATRIAHAFERATAFGAPVIALVASGGSRMQEGTLALVQMPRLADAAWRFRRSGGLYVTYLMHPSTGGALASWASLGSVTLAAPGALVGFAGPRVALALGERPAANRTEALHEAGWIDELVAPAALRDCLARLLRIVAAPSAMPPRLGQLPWQRRSDPWEDLQDVRRADRFGVRELLAAWQAPVFELHGDRGGRGDDGACLAAVARIAGRAVVLVAHNRSVSGGAIGAPGLAKARRAMRLADELGLPLVLVVDTPGAELGDVAIAGEVALTLEALAGLRVPTVSVLLGQGGSGGAVAFLAAGRVLTLARAGLWVIAPEAASAILFRDTDHAPALARAQGGGAADLLARGIVDEVVADDGDVRVAAAALEAALGRALSELETRGAVA